MDMDETNMTSERKKIRVTSGAAMQVASSVAGEAGSSGGKDDGKVAGPSGGARSRPSDGGGAGMAGDAGPSWAGGAYPSSAGGAGPSSAGGAGPSSAGGAGPSWAGGAGPSSAGGAGPSWAGGAGPSSAGGAGPSWAGGAGPSSAGGAGPSWAGGAGPSWAGGAGPSWAGGAGPSWAGEAGHTRGERNKQRKRKNKSTGEVKAKKIKRTLKEEFEEWRSENAITFNHSLYKKHDNTLKPCKRALKRKGDHKEVPSTEVVLMPEQDYINNFNSDPQNNSNSVDKKIFNKAEGDEDFSIAALLHGLSVQGPDDINNAAAGSRRSTFNHQKVVWWTTNNWHEVRKEALEYEDGNVGMASSSRSRRIAQNRQDGVGGEGTTFNSVPERLLLAQPREPLNFYREDAENAAEAAPRAVPRSSVHSAVKPKAVEDWRSNQWIIKTRRAPIERSVDRTARIAKGLRSRLARRKRQRRLAVSDSDIDPEQDQEEFEEFLLFRGEQQEPVVSSEVSDSSPSSLFNSSSDSSEVTTDTE